MSEKVVSTEIDGKIATVTIHREKALNALSREVLTALSDSFTDLEAKEDLSVILLRGAGEKAFVAGADVREMSGLDQKGISEYAEFGQSVMSKIETLSPVVIAVVDGYALGGGMELALAADLIIGSDKARLGQPEVNLGLIPGFGGTQRLVERGGIGIAKRLVLTGDLISGEEAYRSGLIDYLAPADELEEVVSKVSNTIASKGRIAVAEGKRMVYQYGKELRAKGLKAEEKAFIDLFQTEDSKEGMGAFLEGRAPEFKGK